VLWYGHAPGNVAYTPSFYVDWVVLLWFFRRGSRPGRAYQCPPSEARDNTPTPGENERKTRRSRTGKRWHTVSRRSRTGKRWHTGGRRSRDHARSRHARNFNRARR
jgi:hypothetical protein